MEIDREALFALVWSTPISHLRVRYGLSDHAFKKVCSKLQVPLPRQGQWARIAAGHRIPTPPLPPLRDSTATRATNAAAKATASSAREKPVQQPAVPAPVSALVIGQFHSVLRPSIPRYEEAYKQALQLKARFDWEQANPGRTYKGAAPRFGNWEYFCDSGQILRATHRKSFLRVSLTSYRRALLLFQTIVERLELAGFAVQMAPDQERLHAARNAATVKVRVTERLETGQRKKFDAWAKEPRFVRTMTPTGKLTVGIEQEGYGETLVSDRADSRLEGELDAVMAAVTLRHQRSVETRARWEQEERDREARRRAREEELRLEEEARRVAAAEAAKRQALVLEAENWRTAENLRAYLSHLYQVSAR